ncbi:MAG: rod-binding protein [Pseudomonadales bacterium]
MINVLAGNASLSSVSSTPAPMAYTDIRALSSKPVDKAQSLAEAAQQFESLFIDWVLKSMREANASLAEGSYLNSSEVEMHQEMLDHQMAIHLSSNGGLGLRALIMDQLSGPGNSSAQVNSVAADDPGAQDPKQRAEE